MDGAVETVSGSVDAGDLGLTLLHEHVLFDTTAWQIPPAAAVRPELAQSEVSVRTLHDLRHDPLVCRDNLLFADEEVAAHELGLFRAAGGGTVVDVTLPAMGRDVLALRRIAAASGVRIVAGTGHYVQATHPPEVATQSPDEIAAWMIGEIRDGIDGTGIRAGIIGEIGTSGDVHPDEEKTLVAAALAQQETGLAITVHCAIPYEKVGLDVVRILADAGADVERCILGHLSHTASDLDYHRALAATGAVLEYDRFGAEFRYESWNSYEEPRDSAVVAAVAALCGEGHSGRIVLSHDVCYRIQLASFGGAGYGHVARHVVPALVAAGVDEAQIRTMTIETPARVLAVPVAGATTRDPGREVAA